MAAHIPTVKLSNGYDFPVVGLGTYKINETPEELNAIKKAVEIGYRHFDCAWVYANEKTVGRALREAIEESNGALKREDFFITSKIWNTHHSKNMVRKCFQEIIDNLGLGYLDLLLCHWPCGFAENTNQEPQPYDDNGHVIFSDIHYLETYKAMEELQKEGKVRSIGLSNFNPQQVQDVIDNSEIKPVVNQFEVNIYNQNKEWVDFCQSKQIVVTGFAPLGANDRGWMKPEDPIVLNNESILKLAKKYNRSPAQICIKWELQRGIVVIAKSVSAARLLENVNVFDFEISPEDMNELNSISIKFRYYAESCSIDHKYFPLK